MSVGREMHLDLELYLGTDEPISSCRELLITLQDHVHILLLTYLQVRKSRAYINAFALAKRNITNCVDIYKFLNQRTGLLDLPNVNEQQIEKV